MSPMPDQSSVTDLQLLHSTTVTPDQIDQLGHMNVRFYGVHAMAGARKLAAQLELPSTADTDTATPTAFTDLYTRHYLEQLEGSPLEVWGGVLEVRDTNIQTYYELRNPDREELGATFVFTLEHQDSATHAPVPIPNASAEAARAAIIEWPEHGKPRSIDLNNTPDTLSLEEVRALHIEERDIRTTKESQCDENGIYKVDAFQDLVWGSEGISEDNDWLSDLPNGDRMGWATMESRCTLHQLPRAGVRVQSFRAVVEVSRKAQQERFWTFDIDNGILLCTAQFVDVAFNINTRRAIEIPDFARAEIDKHFHPELA